MKITNKPTQVGTIVQNIENSEAKLPWGESQVDQKQRLTMITHQITGGHPLANRVVYLLLISAEQLTGEPYTGQTAQDAIGRLFQLPPFKIDAPRITQLWGSICTDLENPRIQNPTINQVRLITQVGDECIPQE